MRISKIHAKAGRRDAQKAVLDEALARDPEDKAAHFAMAMYLIEAGDGWDRQGVIHHLSASFQVNDSAFEERYILARFFFAIGEIERAVEMFAEIDRRAPKDFRRFAPKKDNELTARLENYSGTVDAAQAGYFFLRSGAYPKRIFAHRSAFEETEVDEIEIGQQVFFRLRFNRQGPVAVSVHLKPSGWEPSVMDLDEVEAELGDILVQ